MAAKRFQGLDGLRGVCALSVLLFHADDLFHQGPIVQHGYLAVDMFFLLSGFVIAFVHQGPLQRGGGLLSFLRARARRLLPVYWLGAALSLAIFIGMASSGFSPIAYSWAAIWIVIPVATLFMLPAYGTAGNSFSPAMTSVTWSLLVEWLVNIAYGAGLFRCRTRTLATLAIAGWLAMAVAGYFTGKGWCVGMNRYDFISYGILRGAPSFLAGVVLCRLHARGWFARLPAIAPEILLTLWLCIAVVPTFSATPTFDWITVMIFCPALVALLLRAEDKAPAYFRRLGDISYPLYVTHPGILALAQLTPLFDLNRRPDPLRALAVIILCVGVAALTAILGTALTRRWPKTSANKGGLCYAAIHETNA